ncbi:hypothetical protein PNEG_01559 [Pneumocystis murina B123]|uniref:CCZ1/INTU/HSP4 first Longin domain-containing protein n=1 Tax=Pneumocystis murina (strain B123) TaxID=1069680 RepID=M7NNP3_PNEMU|nr:hypothetical protein PNEG_01559 [Pneumocystis murina B123]EMR10298.1 hypothetical protein PNEG_01559 [Pneumocystis murina B123]
MTNINFISSEKCPLSYLCIFNPSFGISEGSLHNQILFFISETYISLNDQQRNIGLIQGIMEFSLNFGKKVSNEYIQSKNHVIIVIEVENGWYIAASFFSKFLRKNHIFFPPFTVLFNYLYQAYEQYRLVYGLLDYTLQKDGRKILESQLNEWWQKWVRNLDVTVNDPSILYSAINMGFITPDFRLKEKINKNINDLKASNERIIDLIISSVSPIFNYHKHNEGCLYSGDGTIPKNTIKILDKWLQHQIKELINKVDINKKNDQDNFRNNRDKNEKTTLSVSDPSVEFLNNNSNSSISLWKLSNFFTLSSISANISSYISSVFVRNNLHSVSKKRPCLYNYCSEDNNIFFKYNSGLGDFIYGFIEKHNSDSILSEKKLYIGDNQINQNINSSLNNPKSANDFDLKVLNLNYESDPQYISVSVYYSYPFVYLIALKGQNINTENSEKIFIRNKIFYTNLQCCLEKIAIDIETYFAESFENFNSFFWHIIFDPNTQELYTNVPYSKKNEDYLQVEKNLSTEDILHIHSHALSIFDKIKNSKNGNKINDYILKTSKNFWVCYLHVKEKHIILILKKNQHKENIIHTTIENIFQEAKKYVSKLFNLSDTHI